MVQKENLTIKQLNIIIVIVQDHVSQIIEKKLIIILYKIVGQGLRRSKAQGSLRCGIHCTSSMKVEIQNDEHITVQYYPAHYGHTNINNCEESSHLSENSMTIGGINGNSSSNIINNHHHQQDNTQHSLTHYSSHNGGGGGGGDSSSSLSPGSSSTSPSGGSNSNHAPISIERQSNSSNKNQTNTSNNSNLLQNQMSHCIIISPSFVVEENLSAHSNHPHYSTPVLIVQQQQQQVNHPLSSSSSSTTLVPPSSTSLIVKKEKCVSDIMREAFQLLSYWPLEHHHNLITSENEQQQISHSHFNMDEHLMF